jgi:hypothetical protein
MSQQAVERALGKLVTDPTFRAQFRADPAGTALRAGLALTREELDALARVPAPALRTLEQTLDDRICRLALAEDRS